MTNNETETYLTVGQFSKKHPAFPEGGLRHIIFHKDTNGFANCIVHVGRKVLIKEKAFFAKLDTQNGGSNA